MTVTWVAQVTEKSGRLSNYHLYGREEVPTSRPWLVDEIENAARYAYTFFGIKEFALQCWKVPEIRKFHRNWLMQFDVDYAGSISNQVKIKTASFDVSDKAMWALKENFKSEGKFQPDPEPRIIDPAPNLMAIDTGSSGSMFDLRSTRHGPHSRVSENLGDAPHGPQLRAKSFKPTFRRPLVKHWKESIGSKHT